MSKYIFLCQITKLVIKRSFRENLWFFGPYIFVLIAALWYLAQTDKGQPEIWLDTNSRPWLDSVMVHYTNLGDGITLTILCIVLAFISRKIAFATTAGLLLGSAITQLIKHTVAADTLRPTRLLQDIHTFRDIEFLDRHLFNSMPSGHTTAVFCVFTALSLYSYKKTYGFVFFVLAVSVAFSRMYLSQHFLSDVTTGSIIGTLSAWFCYLLFEEKMTGDTAHKPLFRIK